LKPLDGRNLMSNKTIETVAPENMPLMGNRFTKWLGRSLLRLAGWRLVGEVPNQKKIMLAFTPHTSNWDFIIAMLCVLGFGVKLSYLMKKEAFFWPMAGTWKWLGGIPTDRSAPGGVVEQLNNWYENHEHCWVAITPEGTRGSVQKWKTGFLRIAQRADVPVVILGIDSVGKRVVLDSVHYSEGDFEREAEELKAYVDSKFIGIAAKR